MGEVERTVETDELRADQATIRAELYGGMMDAYAGGAWSWARTLPVRRASSVAATKTRWPCSASTGHRLSSGHR